MTKKKFLFDAMKIKADAFRMPDDSRKWRYNAERRKTLFVNLAAFADKDGRGACPSVKTLCERTGHSRSAEWTYLTDLLLAGWIVNRHTKSRFQGTTTWDLNLIPIVPDTAPTVPDSPSNSPRFEANSPTLGPTVPDSTPEPANVGHDLSLHLPTESAQNDICPPTHLPEADGGMEGGSGDDSKPTSEPGHEKSLWVRLLDAYQNFYDTAERYSLKHELADATYISKVGLNKLESSLPTLLRVGFSTDDVIAGWTKWLFSKFSDLQRTATHPIKFPVAVFADEARFYIELAIKEKLEDEQEEKELKEIALEEKPA